MGMAELSELASQGKEMMEDETVTKQLKNFDGGQISDED